MQQQPSFRPRPDPCPLIEEALDLAIKQSTGNKNYHVSNGRLIYEEHRRYRYAYTVERTWDLPDGTDLQLRSSDFDALQVQLSNTKDDTVTIVTAQRLPDRTLDHAQLVVDRAYLIKNNGQLYLGCTLEGIASRFSTLFSGCTHVLHIFSL